MVQIWNKSFCEFKSWFLVVYFYVASKFIKMTKTGFKIVISQETECLNPFEVYVVTLLRRKPIEMKFFYSFVINGSFSKFSKLVSPWHYFKCPEAKKDSNLDLWSMVANGPKWPKSAKMG